MPALTQDGPRLTAVIRLDRGRPLRPVDTACVALARPGAVRRAICVTGGPRPEATVRIATASQDAVGAPVERIGPRAVRVTVDAGSLSLSGGSSHTATSVITRAGRGEPNVSKPVRFRWRAWRLVGCEPTGPTRIVRAPGNPGRRVALSFDDGPSGYTPAILRVLAEHRARATFFVIGDLVRWRPAVLRRVLSEGHMIGNHSLHHEMPPPAWSIAGAQRAVRAATGFTPCTFRPPGGAYSGSLGAEVRAQGMRTIVWSVDTRDWTRPGADRIARIALSARPGDIILMHDGGGPRAQTIAATGTILRGLAARDIQAVSVEELLGARPRYRFGP